MARRAFAAAVALSTGALLLGCLLARAWPLLPLPVVTTGAWIVCRRVSVRAVADAAAVVTAGAAGAGVIAGLSPVLMLAAALGAVAAWDLEWLARAAQDTADPAAARQAARFHAARLAAVLAAGAVLGAAAVLLRTAVPFAAILAATAVLAGAVVVLLRVRPPG
jgi:hypothetical protein